MTRKFTEEEIVIKVKPNLEKGLILQRSSFIKRYIKLEAFMGLGNARFLTAITNHYNYLRKRKKKGSKEPSVKNGIVFFSYKQFGEKRGASRYVAKKALKEICWLVKKTGNVPGIGWPIVKIDEFACFVFGLIAGSKNISQKRKRQIFEMIRDDKLLQGKIHNRLERMKKRWKKNDLRRYRESENLGDTILSKRAGKDCEDFCDWILSRLG